MGFHALRFVVLHRAKWRCFNGKNPHEIHYAFGHPTGT